MAQLVAWLKRHEAERLAQLVGPERRAWRVLSEEQLAETWRREGMRRP